MIDTLGFIIKDLINDKWRTVITIVNLLVFICCYMAMASLAEATLSFSDRPADASSIFILSRNIIDPAESVVTDDLLEPAKEMMPQYVLSVTPLMYKSLYINGHISQVRAARLEDMRSVHSLTIIAGDWPSPQNQVVIGENTAAITRWQVGDTLRIYGSDFTISGLVSASGSNASAIWMPLDTAEKLFDTDGKYQFIWIQVQPGINPEEIKNQLQNDPRINAGYDVFLANNFYQEYTKSFTQMEGLTGILLILALSSVMLGTYSNVFLVVSERHREITILRAIGIQAITIRIFITIRMLLMILIAYVLSLGLSTLLLNFFNYLNPIIFRLALVPVVVTPRVFFGGLLLSLFFGWIGVWIPTNHLRTKSVAHFIHD